MQDGLKEEGEVAKTPLSAGSIRRPGRSRVRPVPSRPEFPIAKFSRLELPITPSKQRERARPNRQISEGLHFAPWRRYFQATNTERLTSPIGASSNRISHRLELALTHTKQRTTHFSDGRETATFLIAPSTFDGFIFSNNPNMICGTLQGQPVSNVLGTRPN
jgi:hypothetical protein